MTEQRARLVDPAFGDQPADARAADDEVLVADRIDFLGAESVARAQAAQQREVAGAIVAEQKIRAHPHLRDVQPLDEHRAHERFRIPSRQLRCESDDGDAVHAAARQGLELLLVRHQQRRRLVGTDDLRRMRIERHRHRRRAALFGAPAHALDDFQVTAVHAVEIAEREHRLMPPRRPWIVRIVNDLHQRSISKVRPSYANCTAGGQPRAGRRVGQIVAHVREERALGLEPLDHRERLVERQMRRMRPLAQRVENQGAHAAQAAATTTSGMPLQSVRYANEPMR